jgi:hypothetical protein
LKEKTNVAIGHSSQFRLVALSRSHQITFVYRRRYLVYTCDFGRWAHHKDSERRPNGNTGMLSCKTKTKRE